VQSHPIKNTNQSCTLLWNITSAYTELSTHSIIAFDHHMVRSDICIYKDT